MNWNEFKNNVEQWAAERGIYEHSTPQAQLLKALSELGELADAVIKNDRKALKDAIGDVAVCLVNWSRMEGFRFAAPMIEDGTDTTVGYIGDIAVLIGRNLNQWNTRVADCLMMLSMLVGICQNEDTLEDPVIFTECCEAAWNEIKDRTGRMVPGGAFVKED